MTQTATPIVSIKFADAVTILTQVGELVDASQASVHDAEYTLTTDSRLSDPGHIFLAYVGATRDGPIFIPAAISKKVGALIFESESASDLVKGVPWIRVKNGRAAWSWLAAAAFGNPQERLRFVGVTGTDGKTSTTWYCRQLLQQQGIACATIGTLGIWVGERFIPSAHTTPDPPSLFAALADAVKENIGVVVMECSSHAILQRKLDPIKFSAAAFTSFSRDHLDLHGTMDAYYATKWRLFTNMCRPDARVLFSSSLARAPKVSELKTSDIWCYGVKARPRAAEWKIDQLLQVDIDHIDTRQSHFSFAGSGAKKSGAAALPADYAVENLAAATLLAEKISGLAPPASTWAKISPPPGRMQIVPHARGPAVFVDYAHTPGAMENTLNEARKLCRNKLSVVFGCGGDRDRGKRPEMARVAAALADRIIITSDNPRHEDPKAIVADIVAGLSNPRQARVETDRAAAIRMAIKEASAEDVIVVAGKGHENYQIFGNETLHFDDLEEAKKSLEEFWS